MLRVGTHALAQITPSHTRTSGRQSRQRPRLQGASQSPRQGSRGLERPPARAVRCPFAGKSRAGERGGRRERQGVWEQSRNVPWNQLLRRRGTPPHCGFELTTAGGGSGWCSGCSGTGTGRWTGRSCFATFGIDSCEGGSAPLSHPRQRPWGAGLRKAGLDGIGGKRQPRMTVGPMNLAGGSRRPPERRTNRVGPLESTEDQGALRTLRLRIGAEGSPSSL